jgi:hypothetical protein
MYDKPKPITRATALAALSAIRKQFGVGASEIGPTLVKNYESMSGSTVPYAIVWEEGPYDWAIDAFERSVTEFGHKLEGVTRPAGLYAEAINGYALGLYRDDTAAEHTPLTWAQADAVAAKLEAERAACEAVTPPAAPVLKGMRAQIYRHGIHDTSNGGLSSRVAEVTVVGPGIPQLVEPTDDAPAVELGDAGLLGNTVARPRANPPAGSTPWMSGGAFIFSNDSRFPYGDPIRLHDRSESWAQYDALSR